MVDVLGTDPDLVTDTVQNNVEFQQMLGISRSYVSRIEKRALEKLIKDLN